MQVFNSIILVLAWAFAPLAHADFGEVDLLVRESIAIHFQEYHLSVDLQRLNYIGEPSLKGDILTVRSSVWAEQRLISPFWGWQDCYTQIEVKGPDSALVDLGTECFFDF